MMTKTRILILGGAVLAFLGGGSILWYAIPDGDMPTIFVMAFYLLAVAFATYGMWLYRRWALILSRVLAVTAFGFGIYMAHFAWTFWLFQVPTLADRIRAVLRPQVSLFLIGPIVWLGLTLIPKLKGKFAKS
jgi:hypothetical protein